MGRSALILVMMLGVVFGIISININSTNTRIVESQSGYYNYSFARNLSRIGVHRTLRSLDQHQDDTTYTPPSGGSFNDGSYTIGFRKVVDTIWLTSKGIYADTNYTMNVKLARTVKPFPTSYGGVGISAPLQSITFNGNPTIDGRNHDINGNLLNPQTGNVPGLAVLSSADSIKAVAAGGDILGTPKIGVNPNQEDPSDYVHEYAEWADRSYDQSNPPVKGECGTIANPKIVVCNAGEDTNQTVTFPGGFSGCGILVINGKVKIPGNFSWNGLIIFTGLTNVVEVDPAGNFDVTGGMILSGKSAKLTLRGTSSDVLYSSAALDNTKKKVSQLQFYDIMEWYE